MMNIDLQARLQKKWRGCLRFLTRTEIQTRIKFLFACALFLGSTGVRATTLARLSLDQLAGASDAVARVHCITAESHWENGAIWTITTFDVVETMKGNLQRQVTVRVPGGRLGHFTDSVDGAPKFHPDEDAILFLERAQTGTFSVAGWVEGTFRIVVDSRTHVETVTQDSSSFAVFDTATRTFRNEGIQNMPIEQFRRHVAASLTRAREKAQ